MVPKNNDPDANEFSNGSSMVLTSFHVAQVEKLDEASAWLQPPPTPGLPTVVGGIYRRWCTGRGKLQPG